MSKNAHRAAMRTLAVETLAVLREIRDRMPERRPESCCGDCPPIVGGGYDCTCDGNERCGRSETVTVTLPRDVVEPSAPVLWRDVARGLHEDGWLNSARLIEALADAMEVADTPPEPTTATQDAPSGRIGWVRLYPDDDFRDLVREVEDGWSCDESDLPDFPSKHYPDAVFTPIATLPEGYVAVERRALLWAMRQLEAAEAASDEHYRYPHSRRVTINALRAALEGGRS